MAPYEFPCFIVTVDNSSPDKAAGASYFGEVTPLHLIHLTNLTSSPAIRARPAR